LVAYNIKKNEIIGHKTIFLMWKLGQNSRKDIFMKKYTYLLSFTFLLSSCFQHLDTSLPQETEVNDEDPYIKTIEDKGYENPLASFKNTKVRVVWLENPSTEAIIGWDSKTRRSERTVYYDTVDHGLDYKKYRFNRYYERQVRRYFMKSTFVKLTNLKPETKYYFVIKDKGRVSSRYWFKTASENPQKRLSFISGGDSRNNRGVRRDANKLVAKLKPDAVLFGGDFTNLSFAIEWRRWFSDWQLTISPSGRITPLIPARGNHERSNSILSDLFNLPLSNYYGTSFGTNLLRIYTLNSEAPVLGDQKDWIESDLSKKGHKFKWLISQYHKPMRPHVKKKSEGNNVYNAFARLFYDYQFSLVIECDSHTVKQTFPIRPLEDSDQSSDGEEGFIRDDDKGTVYIGEGTWGAPLRIADDNKKWTKSSGVFNQFKWIFVDDKSLEVRTVKYENGDKVKELSDKSRFDIPQGLNTWKPGYLLIKK